MEKFLSKFTVVDGAAHVAVDPVEADAAPVRVAVLGDTHLILIPHRELDREGLRTQKSGRPLKNKIDSEHEEIGPPLLLHEDKHLKTQN